MTAARGMLASTMLNAYAITDTILVGHHFGDGSVGASEGLAAEYLEDVLVVDDIGDRESVPGEVKEGMRSSPIVQYDQWKYLDTDEVRQNAGMYKERERMSREGAHGFLTGTGAWLSP